ncbi:hypothetical protein BDV33DRAFT_168752 [Aspergillus novoparasiticus]|uniref:Uncharacterized protein n=1 Tax=Aspergillus novoparasiticus TaxID=986946 RepID=A0A5N6EYN2_9EURO|nr:hypothetical protein BDV33DRAFT_168752 [Aspergillus novoparasiticus]
MSSFGEVNFSYSILYVLLRMHCGLVTCPTAFERREAQKEKARKERFTRGVHHERSGIPEKMYDNRRVELPADSRYELPNGYENGERSTNMKMGSAGARVNRAGWVEMDVLGAPRR